MITVHILTLIGLLISAVGFCFGFYWLGRRHEGEKRQALIEELEEKVEDLENQLSWTSLTA